MPWALTCAGAGAVDGEGEVFREPGTVARVVVEGWLPAPCSARAPACGMGEAEARWDARLAEGTESMSLMAPSTAAEMTTPAVTPSARSIRALLEWREPSVGVGIDAGRGWEGRSAE